MKLGIAGLLVVASAFIGSFSSLDAQMAGEAPSASSVKTIWDGVYTAEQAARGQAVYAPNCMFCHGETLTDSKQDPPLAGDAFLESWKGTTLDALFEKMNTMMPPSDPGGLTKEQYVDVLAYMLSVGKAQAGSTELKPDTEALRQIRIELKP